MNGKGNPLSSVEQAWFGAGEWDLNRTPSPTRIGFSSAPTEGAQPPRALPTKGAHPFRNPLSWVQRTRQQEGDMRVFPAAQ